MANGKFDVYEHVTNQIMSQLEAGTIPWRKPWTAGEGVQRNFNSNRPYRGLNQLLLSMSGFGSPLWMTAKGVKRAGGTLKPSEFFKNGGRGSTVVILWKPIVRKDPDTGEDKTIMFLRSYNVWNVDQCDGIDVKTTGDTPDADPIEPIETAEAMWQGYEGKPTLDFGGGRAFYRPADDHIQMPFLKDFESAEAYYSTLFHEGIHSTGHKDRLNRKGVAEIEGFGSKSYSDEELVAEMGAAFLCAHAGISSEREIENSAAYIAGWLKRLSDDKKLVVYAGARAQKGADHIMGVKFDKESDKD